MQRRSALAIAMLALATPLGAQRAPVTGIVRNAATHGPVRIAVVRAPDAGVSTLTDDAGRFRLQLPLGAQRLEVRRIGFRPATARAQVVAAGTAVDVELAPIAVGLERVIVTARDDAARRIIAAAIRRKHETRTRTHDYAYEGDVQFVVRDLRKPADSASSIVLITQSRTSAYWEQPNRFQETIVARRQTGNLAAEQNLVGVGQIVNFSRDRVQLGRFELASPVADDALDRYEYRILDTLVTDGRRVFRLSLEPVEDGTPAFAGIIDIADSTFDVTGIDVGVNNAVRLGLARNVRYQQRFGDVGAGRWMPRTIELSLEVSLPIGKVQYGVRQIAELSAFRFDEGKRPPGLGEYRIVVADSADRADTATWRGARAIPLTPVEQRGWDRIDSIRNAPVPLPRRVMRGVVAGLRLASDPDVFHFNRVDGTYVGVHRSWYLAGGPVAAEPTVKLGRAQATGVWQYRGGGRVRLDESRRVWVGALVRDETRRRPTLTSPGYNPTLRALFSAIDPLDYYRERGIDATFSTKVVDRVQLDATFTDARQSSLALAVDQPLLRRSSRTMRPNDPIEDGHLRALSAGLAFDTRPLLRQAGRDLRINAPRWTRLAVEAEASPGGALGGDFRYHRYAVRVDRRQQSFGLGITSVLATGGIGDAGLPAQRWFGVDGGAQVLEVQASPFSTLLDSTLSVPRAAVLAVQHDFDRLLFIRSGLPLVRDLPFTLAVRGSTFWAGTAGLAPAPGRLAIGSPYSEAGFTLGNLTPFLAPINLSARFAWQLSSYPTTPFRFSIGFGA